MRSRSEVRARPQSERALGEMRLFTVFTLSFAVKLLFFFFCFELVRWILLAQLFSPSGIKGDYLTCD